MAHVRLANGWLRPHMHLRSRQRSPYVRVRVRVGDRVRGRGRGRGRFRGRVSVRKAAALHTTGARAGLAGRGGSR